MKTNWIKLVFIVDESGSMSHSRQDVIGSFNQMIREYGQNKESNVRVSLFKFNNDVEYIIKNKDIRNVRLLKSRDYQPNGFTALYDAIGRGITTTDSEHTELFSNEQPKNIIAVIITDGQENASREYSLSSIKSMINTHERLMNWRFIFIGADLDNFDDAHDLGIRFKISTKKTELREDMSTFNNMVFSLADSDQDIDDSLKELTDEMNDKHTDSKK